METKYTIDYFINKFSAIPDDKWCRFSFEREGKHCALGHCGATGTSASPQHTEESKALCNIFGSCNIVMAVNDEPSYMSDLGVIPKNRVLRKLRELKAAEKQKQQKELLTLTDDEQQ